MGREAGGLTEVTLRPWLIALHPSSGLGFPRSPAPPEASPEARGPLGALTAGTGQRPSWRSAREDQQDCGDRQDLAQCVDRGPPRRPRIQEDQCEGFASLPLSPELPWASWSFPLAGQPDGVHPVTHRSHPDPSRSAQAIDFEKNLVPGEPR